MVRVHFQIVDQVSLGDSGWGVVLRCPRDGKDDYCYDSILSTILFP